MNHPDSPRTNAGAKGPSGERAPNSVSTHITLDTERDTRLGFDEAIYGQGKSVAQLEEIAARILAEGSRALFTRLEQDQLGGLSASVRAEFDWDPVSRTGILGSTYPMREHTSRVAVVTAGTTDVPVAREASRTLGYYGEPCLEIFDVGVAGLWRLLERTDTLRQCEIVVTVAGMDAALPSVVGGLVPGAVIAVPTSTGYGVAEGGTSALYASLASCAPGVVVVNIDNGYGAACAALRMRALARGTLLTPGAEGEL